MKNAILSVSVVFFLILTFNANVGMAQTEWEKYPGNPVLDVGHSGSWDDVDVWQSCALFDGTEYKMWYSGNDGSTWRIGYATSPDGIVWTKYPGNPVLDLGPSGTWDDDYVISPTVLFEGTGFKLWYHGYDGSQRRIGYATSPDGIVWTKFSDNPVIELGPTGAWDDDRVSNPSVLFDGIAYKLWYAGHDGSHDRIGYATSLDGIVWTKFSGTSVLDLGPSGTWDDDNIVDPTVIFNGTEYMLFYAGADGSTWQIGYATSPDGIVWTKYPGNPILDLGPSGTWDDAHLRGPTVLFDSLAYKLWYSGHDGSCYRLGCAISLPDSCDIDGDGSFDVACGGWDCDDSDPDINPGIGVYPGAPELCDGLDTDCDGTLPDDEFDDGDGDGYMICEGDCDDTDPDVNPLAEEGPLDDPTCSDGIDNDCDGLIDTDPECIAILVPGEQSTIHDAINAAESGNTIFVGPGFYQENIDFMGKAITVKSLAGPTKTIIDGDRAGSVVIIASGETEDAVLDGFTLQNGSGTFITLPYVGAGFYSGGGIFCEGSSPTITNCKIANNYAYFGGGIYLRASAPTITNCMIVKNWATGIIHGGGGIYLEDSSPTITNCTMADNYAIYYGGGIFCWNSSPTITNSILWSDYSIFDPEIHVRSGSSIVTYSDVEAGWPGEGNIEENPFFIGGGNYHLRLISPCIDAGTDAGVYTDMDGQSRPWGAGFDMGADEFSTEPCSVIASSGNQFLTLYLIPAVALIFFSRRFLRR